MRNEREKTVWTYFLVSIFVFWSVIFYNFINFFCVCFDGLLYEFIYLPLYIDIYASIKSYVKNHINNNKGDIRTK